MLGNGSEDAPTDALDIACAEVLGEHRCYSLVAGAATDRGSVIVAAEDGVLAEKGC